MVCIHQFGSSVAPFFVYWFFVTFVRWLSTKNFHELSELNLFRIWTRKIIFHQKRVLPNWPAHIDTRFYYCCSQSSRKIGNLCRLIGVRFCLCIYDDMLWVLSCGAVHDMHELCPCCRFIYGWFWFARTTNTANNKMLHNLMCGSTLNFVVSTAAFSFSSSSFGFLFSFWFLFLFFVSLI